MKNKLALAILSLVAFAMLATTSVSTLVAVDQSVPYEVMELAGGGNENPGGG